MQRISILPCLRFAEQSDWPQQVTFQAADAQDLPFADDSFDLVACQFGVMFFPDKLRANQEARRVLAPHGRYLLVTFDRLEHNRVPKAAGDAASTAGVRSSSSSMPQPPHSLLP